MLYDPLVPMLKNTNRLFQKKPEVTCGVFEHIPFKDEQFDAVLSGYSLRDAISLKIAISEFHRILKKDSRLVIVDLGKPDNQIIRFGVSLYLKTILPIIAYVIGGKLGLKFAALYETYRLWPQNRKLESLLNEKFSKIEFEKGCREWRPIVCLLPIRSSLAASRACSNGRWGSVQSLHGLPNHCGVPDFPEQPTIGAGGCALCRWLVWGSTTVPL